MLKEYKFSLCWNMQIKKCSLDDVKELAIMNKMLIEDEKSNNSMSLSELESRMKDFLSSEYTAYFFITENAVVGYALVKHTAMPLYLRQFFIKQEYRRQHYGTEAFEKLLKVLDVKNIDVEVLSWNEQGVKFWTSIGFKEISRYMRLER